MTEPDPDPSAPSFTDPAGEYPPTADERNLAVLAHLSGCAGILGAGLLGFVGPLIIYLLKKDSSPYIEAQSKEALNFQITIILAMIASAILTVVVIGVFLWFATVICDFIFCILACVAASKGEDYRYPISLRLVK